MLMVFSSSPSFELWKRGKFNSLSVESGQISNIDKGPKKAEKRIKLPVSDRGVFKHWYYFFSVCNTHVQVYFTSYGSQISLIIFKFSKKQNKTAFWHFSV